MAETLSGVNGEIIRWARESYHLSADEAAHAIGVASEQYQRWEAGEAYPTYVQLKAISEVLHKPSAVFFFPEPPKLPAIKADLHTLPNAASDGLSKNVILQCESARAYQLNLRELYGEGHSLFSRRDLLPERIADLCGFLRLKLDFPIAAQKAMGNASAVFELFREKLYDLGVYVFRDDFGEERVSALSVSDGAYPVLVINDAMPYERQNAALFRALYHLVLHTDGVDLVRGGFCAARNEEQAEEEKLCDAFASAFLVPAEDLAGELKQNGQEISGERIAVLAALYSVGREVVLYQLLQMNGITGSMYESFQKAPCGDTKRLDMNGRPSTDGDEYQTQFTRLGRKYTKAVLDRWASGMIDPFQASEMLRCKVDQLGTFEALSRGQRPA